MPRLRLLVKHSKNNQIVILFCLPMVCSLKTFRYWKYLLVNNLLSINTEFVEWLSGLLNKVYPGWKGRNSLKSLGLRRRYLPSHPWKWSHQLSLHTSSDSGLLSVKASCPTVGRVSLLECYFLGCEVLHRTPFPHL